MIIHNKYIKWKQELHTDLCESLVDFGREHLSIYKVTNVPKYRSFQYRILQRGITTNIQLYKWNMAETEMCSYCKENKETLTHLFYDCKYAQELWVEVLQLIQRKTHNSKIAFNAENVILNKLDNQRGSITNFICLMTKQYIYKQRCLKEEINFHQFQKQLKLVENIERYIAIKNNRLAKHKLKWNPIN